MTSFLSGIATSAGIVFGNVGLYGAAFSSLILNGFFSFYFGAFFGIAGLGAGVLVGSLVYWLIGNIKTRAQYKEALTNNKNSLIDNFEKMEKSFSNDYAVFEQTLMKEMKAHVEALYEELNFENSKWVKIKQEYEKQKESIKLKLKVKKNNNL